ncbi:hypothetical protein GGR57DRAFT_240839 [Xylariaceae sp. FL1272]|nr:hypothetical protein GGR57DRAFT_240839 [Xylariaceae sp. FL1272]
MFKRCSSLWALLCFAIYLNGITASPTGPVVRRQDVTSTSAELPSTMTAAEKENETSVSTQTGESLSTRTHTSRATTTVEVKTSSSTPFPSAINDNNPGNSSSIEPTTTVLPGHLPLQPELTPGWGVAGAILLITGALYGLIGIKNGWVHSFLSSAFLSGLSITVLVVYIMNPPISNSVQGAYVVAAVVPGLILGGIAIVFREITEGFACILGGFCLAMWFLTLKAGGLLPTSTGKIILIAVLTAASYMLYFIRKLRAYALLISMAFAGATATVLGIDCFSKAGLKEFWAYIWNLNNGKIFPYGTDTYPITRGIRVEIAVIAVLTVVGVISQLKLWRVIQQRRDRKAEEQAEERQKRDEEEAKVGQQIEAEAQRERRVWENVYGDQTTASLADSGDSDPDNEKKGHPSHISVKRVSLEQEDAIEMTDLPASTGASSPDLLKKIDENTVDQLTMNDAGPHEKLKTETIEEPEEKVWIVSGSGEARPLSLASQPDSKRLSRSEPPQIIPLPFAIPNGPQDTDNRSSFATYADEDDRSIMLSKRGPRISVTNRLSVNSGNLLRSLSQKSGGSHVSKRKSSELSSPLQNVNRTSSTEELVLEHSRRSLDAASSVAATVDGTSVDGETHGQSLRVGGEQTYILEVTGETDGDEAEGKLKLHDKSEDVAKSKLSIYGPYLDTRPPSAVEPAGTDMASSQGLERTSGSISKSSTNRAQTDASHVISNGTDISAPEDTPQALKGGAAPASPSALIFAENGLQSELSRVAVSYRTNEWAKHLSHAEAPVEEKVEANEPSNEHPMRIENEVAAPLQIDELHQTPILCISGTPSAMSDIQSHRPASRSSSHSSHPVTQVPSTLAILTGGQSHSPTPERSASGTAPQHFRSRAPRRSDSHIRPILEESVGPVSALHRLSSEGSSTRMPNSISPSPTDSKAPTPRYDSPASGLQSHTSPQSLIAQRDMLLRNKSQSQLLTAQMIQEQSHQLARAQSQIPSNSPYINIDADDLPLSQRKELMRQNSMLSVHSVNARPKRTSTLPAINLPAVETLKAENTGFNSHQPQRVSSVPSQLERDARLANFRMSVAADLRSGTTLVRNGGHDTPASPMPGHLEGHNEIGRSLEHHHSIMLNQKDQETQRRERAHFRKQRNDRIFEEKMQSGELIDKHRSALRRMQSNIK